MLSDQKHPAGALSPFFMPGGFICTSQGFLCLPAMLVPHSIDENSTHSLSLVKMSASLSGAFSLPSLGFPGGSENLPANAGNAVWIAGLGRSPGKGNGNPLQYSCLDDPMDGGAW